MEGEGFRNTNRRGWMSCAVMGLWFGPSESFAPALANTGSAARGSPRIPVCLLGPENKSMIFPQIINKVTSPGNALNLRAV